MSKVVSPKADLWLGAGIVLLCAATIWDGWDLPEGSFEPLGSGPVPRWTAFIIIGLTLLVMFQAWHRLRMGWQPDDGGVVPRWADALMVCVVTIVYALLLQFRIGRFDWLTTVYLFVCIGLLVRFRLASLLWVGLVSALFGFGTNLIFTKVFVVDLPGAF